MDKKFKIVFLSRFQGTVHRGVETYVLELSKRLNKNFEVSILSGYDSDNLSRIIRGNYDVVITTNGRWQALKASLGRFFGKYKLIIPGQAGIGKDDIWNISICNPNVYVGLTDYEMNWAKKFAWYSRLVKIPNGVDLEKFSPFGRKINIDLEKPIILSVGALEWYKHHELAIKAVSRLGKGSLLIVGSGSQKAYLTSLGQKNLENRFKIISSNFDRMPDYYRAADLFTLPSWDREAFGIVYVEAMASGLGVVAPDDLLRREIVNRAGILTDVFDSKKYAKSLEEALNKNWESIARQQAEKFSWDKVALEYEKLIKEICS